MERVLDLIDRVNDYQGRIFSFLIVVATIQICYELTLRYVFNAPTIWGLELTEYLCATTYVMGGAYAHKLDAHIKVDFFYQHWSPRKRAIFDLCVANVMLFFFCGVLVWQSAVWSWEAITRNMTSGTIWDPPIWPMRLVLFFGSLLLLLQGVAKFCRDLALALGRRESS